MTGVITTIGGNFINKEPDQEGDGNGLMSDVKKRFDCKNADRAAVISSDYGNSNKWRGDMTEMVDTGSMDANSRRTDAHSRLEAGYGGVNRRSERADRVITIGGYPENSSEWRKEASGMGNAKSMSANGKTSDRVPRISGGPEGTSKIIQVGTQAQTFRRLTGAAWDHAPGLIRMIGSVNAKGWTPDERARNGNGGKDTLGEKMDWTKYINADKNCWNVKNRHA